MEYDDLFEGSPVIAAKVQELIDAAQQEIEVVQKLGGPLYCLILCGFRDSLRRRGQ